jgi:hypothetical protein
MWNDVVAFLFTLAISYLIPQGIVCFLQWKEGRQLARLSLAVSFLAGGSLTWIYFLFLFVFRVIKYSS